MRESIRVLLVDDHPAVRSGLRLLLQTEGFAISGEAEGQADALASADGDKPDLAIVDLSLDQEDGLPLVKLLRERKIPVLIYSMHQDVRHVREALNAGALGYVAKREFEDVLISAIRDVASGCMYLSPLATAVLEGTPAQLGRVDIAASLSAQEYEVYRLIGRGEGTPEIASELGISAHTVESYYARIRDKLGLNSMHRLRRHAIDHFQMRA